MTRGSGGQDCGVRGAEGVEYFAAFVVLVVLVVVLLVVGIYVKAMRVSFGTTFTALCSRSSEMKHVI